MNFPVVHSAFTKYMAYISSSLCLFIVYVIMAQTRWGRDDMDAILRMTSSDLSFGMEIDKFWF